MSEAATATGKSRSTIQRMRDSGAFPQAIREDGTWRIPVDDLLAAGLTLAKSATNTPPKGGAQPAQMGAQTPARAGAQGAHSQDELDALALRVEVEREHGLRVAAEREVQALTAHLTTAQQTIRMIEAAPPRVEVVEVPKIETRVERVPVVERVEVPITPRWVWPVIVTAVVLCIAAAALIGTSVTHRTPTSGPEPPTPGNTHWAPTAPITEPIPPRPSPHSP